jgi:RNA polymerase sigma-70 factor, ECF subfamily
VSNAHLLDNVATARSSAVKRSAETTERELLADVAAGNRSAMAKLYASYFARLATFFVHVTANADLVDELISATMLDVWRGSPTIGPDTTVSVWVMGIAYMHIQKRLGAPSGLCADHDSSAAMTRDTLPRVHDFLPRLTVEERAVLHLVYARDHSRQDIVYIMNVSRECVEMNLTNARLRLRSSFDDSESA